MDTFQFYAPTRIISSAHCAESLAQILEREKCGRLAILVDQNVAMVPRVRDLVQRSEQLCQDVTVVEIEAREPDTDFVDEHTARFNANSPDMLVGIGGGSTLDLAKAAGNTAIVKLLTTGDDEAPKEDPAKRDRGGE